MNIGEAAKTSGVSAKMIRYYESVGLIDPAYRTGNNYRVYENDDVHTLRFIRHTRELGFSMEEAAALLELWRDKSRASADVKRIAANHIDDLQTKISKLQAMVDTLSHLSDRCSGNKRPNCPILDKLADGAAP